MWMCLIIWSLLSSLGAGIDTENSHVRAMIPDGKTELCKAESNQTDATESIIKGHWNGPAVPDSSVCGPKEKACTAAACNYKGILNQVLH